MCLAYCMHSQRFLYSPCDVPCRVCLGQQLAKINIPTAVAMLLREFHMELAAEVRLQHPSMPGYPDCTSILIAIPVTGCSCTWRPHTLST